MAVNDTIGQRIRALAYRLWEEEGCPEGQADAHWERASLMIAQGEERKSHDRPEAEKESEEGKVPSSPQEFPLLRKK